MYLSGVPPLCPNPQRTAGHFFCQIFFKRTLKATADHCQSKLHAKQIFLEVREFKPVFFPLLYTSRDSLPVIYFKEKDFQNIAGAKCRGGEEGSVWGDVCLWDVSGEEYWNSRACHHHHQSSSHFSPKCLSFVFLCPSSSSLHILIHVTGGTTKTPISIC